MQTIHGKRNSHRLLINVRGCNGSGKSTIPLSMMDDPEMYVIEKPYKNKQRKLFTVFPSYGWMALGSYHNKCGGLDGYVDTDMIKKGFWYALKHFPEYNILMEGVIPSTVYSTYEKLFLEAMKMYPERKFIVLNLLPPVEECLKRIQARNGGKEIKEDLVRSKWSTVANNADKFSASGIISLKWDNSKKGENWDAEHMITNMIRFIKKELKR